VRVPAIKRLSPNHDHRNALIDMIVLHYTGMKDCASALDRLCSSTSKVSGHYLIDEDGTIYALVDEARRAWHAGVASWHGETDINSCSIGIELVNPGHEFGYCTFPDAQMKALERLCVDLMERHDISAARVLGHADVAPSRKQDPGELFDWSRLAALGLAVLPEPVEVSSTTIREGDAGGEVLALQVALGSIGYGIVGDSRYGVATTAVVKAFQRHYRPAAVDGVADPETRAMLAGLVSLFFDV
jgi:N-acetylmuramoyl-L-alanine amidase